MKHLAAPARAVSGGDDHRPAAPVLGPHRQRAHLRGRPVVQRRARAAGGAARRDQGLLRSVGAVRAAVRHRRGRPRRPQLPRDWSRRTPVGTSRAVRRRAYRGGVPPNRQAAPAKADGSRRARGRGRTSRPAAARSCGSTVSARNRRRLRVARRRRASAIRRDPRMTKTRTETDTFGRDRRFRPTAIGARRRSARSRISASAASACRCRSIRALGARQEGRGRGQPWSSARSTDASACAPSSRRPQEVIDGKLDEHFPLVVWQTGSGTQTNMNVNEVIANRANEMLGGRARRQDAGASQRSRQYEPVVERQLPDRDAHRRARGDHRSARSRARPSACRARRQGARRSIIVKIGRTHLQDATPLTLGQEFSGYAAQVEYGIARIAGRCRSSIRWPRAAPRSAPASTRRRASPSCSPERVADLPACRSSPPPTSSRRSPRTTPSAVVQARSPPCATGLFKIANDIRLLGSGRAPASAN